MIDQIAGERAGGQRCGFFLIAVKIDQRVAKIEEDEFDIPG